MKNQCHPQGDPYLAKRWPCVTSLRSHWGEQSCYPPGATPWGISAYERFRWESFYRVTMKNMRLPHNVTKWRHNVSSLTYLESTHRGVQFEVLHDMVPKTWKFDLGVKYVWPEALTMKVKANRHQKLISWAPDHELYSPEAWRRSDQNYSKNKGFVDSPDLWQSDLDLWPWPSKFCALKGTSIDLWYAKLQKFPMITVLCRVIYTWLQTKKK